MVGRAKWITVLAVLSAVSCGVALSSNDSDTPAWLLVAGPVLLFVAVGVTWLFLLVILPRLQRQQRTD